MDFGSTGFRLCGFDFWTGTGSSATTQLNSTQSEARATEPAAGVALRRHDTSGQATSAIGKTRSQRKRFRGKIHVWLRNQIDSFGE